MDGIVMSTAHLSPIMDHIISRGVETLSFFSTVINLSVEQTIHKELKPHGPELRSYFSDTYNKACGNAFTVIDVMDYTGSRFTQKSNNSEYAISLVIFVAILSL